jgi:4-amino-4-deoxy-L-arabinose transferase-like glycosyltransferase
MRTGRVVLILIMAVYAVAALGVAFTKAPFCDEGWLASPGLNLIRHGTLETSAIETAGSWLKQINRFTYWVMPLWLLASALWYRIFGFGLTTLRSLSVLWGVAGIGACFVIAKRLSGQKSTAVLACAVLAFDTNFIINGGTARMDMMSAMCGFSGIAIYLWLRETHFARAILFSNVLVAAGVFSHPNGVIAFAGLIFLTIYFDARRIRWTDIGLAAAPYVLGLAAWGLYIRHDPQAFVAQFTGNAKPGSRGLIFYHPLQALQLELTNRYLDAYSFYASGLKRLRALPLVLYAAAFLGGWLTPGIRRDPGLRAALWLMSICCTMLFLIDGIKRSFYLVHVLGPIAIVSAIWLTWLWRMWPRWRPAIGVAVAAIFAVQLAGVASLIANENRQRLFNPVISFLRQHDAKGALVMGPSELGFGLGYTPSLVDDYRLGYYSGKHPEFLVVDDNYRAFFESLAGSEPDVYKHVKSDLDKGYTPVFHNALYVVYKRVP